MRKQRLDSSRQFGARKNNNTNLISSKSSVVSRAIHGKVHGIHGIHAIHAVHAVHAIHGKAFGS